ncbi:S66 peptidase family protein [Flagellimonas sp.]|uniref:S66 peptidase family protein n=1 Tax=Flagellimonas sp. TaxID=2058762 RepID=UPI003B59F7C3
MKITLPYKINKNSTIGVFTPSEPITPKREERLIRNINYLKSCGFQVKTSKNYKSTYFYMSGTVDQRVKDISSLLNDDNVHILMASWGGKSSSQLIKHIDYNLIRKKRKPITAFSDGTLILNAIFSQTGLISFVGPNVVGKLDESKWSDLKHLQRGMYMVKILNKNNIDKIISHGKAKGRLVGGNLSTFTLGLVGTKYMPNIENMIFFWESGSASPQILDQYLTLLDNCGFLSKLSGMVVGTMEFCVDEKWNYRSPFEIISDILKKYNIPIIQTESFGHGNRENPIFPIGALCEIDTSSPSMTVIEKILE